MPTLLYARYPAPQIIQAVEQHQSLFFNRVVLVKNLIYDLKLLEAVCAANYICIGS